MSKKMPAEKFIPIYLAAVDADMKRDEFAKKLGVRTETVYQRVYDLNTKHDAGLPQLKLDERLTKSEAVKAAIAQYRSGKKPSKSSEQTSNEELEALLKG